MTLQTHIPQLLSQFRRPTSEIRELSFCKGSRPAQVKEWAEALPAMRINVISALLYKALPEVSRLATSADNRLEMLEALRPYVQDCITGLAKHFLSQPLGLPESPLKSAVVAQALQRHMTNAYTALLQDFFARSRKSSVDPRFTLACHRAVTGYGLMLLRNYQLYAQVPPRLWLDLHSLFRIGQAAGLLEQAVSDPLLKKSSSATLAQAYTRVLLLACSRPNQMRSNDVAALYEALEGWVYLVRLEPLGQRQSDSPFVLDLAADMPPVYRARFGADPGELMYALDTRPLLKAFRQERQVEGMGGISIPLTISLAVGDHLEDAWGGSRQRSFDRQSGKGPVDVCVGLSALHHHIIGGISLDEFTGDPEEEEIDLGASLDAWGSTRSSGDESFPQHSVLVVNNSPGGYCLEWRNQIPPQVRAGEVLGLREQGRQRWSIGVIRWLQQQDQGTRIGIQLLAPKASAYAAALEQPTGDFSDYRRVLMLPELKGANQPATLLCPFAPFQENQRLTLNANGNTAPVQLTRRLFSTGSVSQFAFRELESEVESQNDDASWNE